MFVGDFVRESVDEAVEFIVVEAQRLFVEHGDAIFEEETMHAQRRRRAREEHEVEILRRMAEDGLRQIMRGGVVDQVIVVEDEDARLRRGVDCAKNGAQELGYGDLSCVDERKEIAERRKVRLQCVADVMQEEIRIVVFGIERKPDRCGGAGGIQQGIQPHRAERGLSVAGWGDDLDQGEFTPSGQRLEKARPTDPAPSLGRKGVLDYQF